MPQNAAKSSNIGSQYNVGRQHGTATEVSNTWQK